MATVSKKGNGSYRIRVYLGYDADGKQIERTKTWSPPAGMNSADSYKEALRQAVLFEEQLRSANYCDGRIRLADFADIWFETYAEPSLRPKTVARYKEMYQRVRAHLGHLPLDKIRPNHILAFYNILEKEGAPSSYRSCTDLEKLILAKKGSKSKFAADCGLSRNTLRAAIQKASISLDSAEKIANTLELPLDSIFKPLEEPKYLSATTIHHHHRFLSAMLNDAVNWQYLASNPCSRIESPKADIPEISFLDNDSAKHFVELLQKIDNPGFYRRPILILLLSGLRRSELLGLEWQDVDFENKTLRISRTAQVNPADNSIYTEKTKNKSSTRIVYVSDTVLDLLREQWMWQKMQEKKNGKELDHNRIFTKPNGDLLHPNRLTTWFRNFVRKTDLPQGLHLHSLRHTYATLCIDQKIPIPAVSAQLGHSSIRTTISTYTHSVKSSQISAAVQISKIFSDVI